MYIHIQVRQVGLIIQKQKKQEKKNKNKNVRSAGLTFRRHYSPIDAMIHGPFMQERWNTTNQNGILNCRRKKTANDRKASNWQDSPIYSPNAVLSALILFPPFYSLFITSVLLWGRAQHDGWWDDVSHPSVRPPVCVWVCSDVLFSSFYQLVRLSTLGSKRGRLRPRLNHQWTQPGSHHVIPIFLPLFLFFVKYIFSLSLVQSLVRSSVLYLPFSPELVECNSW